MKQTIHWKTCEAPICFDDTTPDWKQYVIWYPGEKICFFQGYEKVRQVQTSINDLLKQKRLKNPYQVFTFEMLVKIKRVDPGIKGRNPNSTPDYSRGETK